MLPDACKCFCCSPFYALCKFFEQFSNFQTNIDRKSQTQITKNGMENDLLTSHDAAVWLIDLMLSIAKKI